MSSPVGSVGPFGPYGHEHLDAIAKGFGAGAPIKRAIIIARAKHVMYVTCVIVRDYYVVPNCAGARAIILLRVGARGPDY